MKFKFSLVEILIVIAILGILTGIIIPNTSHIKEKASIAAINSNLKNVQTAVDLYMIENRNFFPAIDKPSITKPSQIDFNLLYPNYLKNKPYLNGFHYWVDSFGKVWCSSLDSPLSISNKEGILSWNKILHSKYYNVFELTDTTSGYIDYTYKKIGISTKSNYLVNTDNQYLVNVVDKYNLESAPVGEDYSGLTNIKPKAIISVFPDINVNNKTVLDWSYDKSIDSNGDNLIPEWTLNDIVVSEMPSNLPIGTNVVKLRVFDGEFWSDFDTKELNISAFNNVPVANIEIINSNSLSISTVVEFSSNSSTDPDGDEIVNAEWQINGIYSSNPNRTYSGGYHVVSLRVQDSKGDWSNWVSKSFYVVDPFMVSSIKSTSSFSMALMKDGTVKSWGSNNYKQLGYLTSSTTSFIPKTISDLNNVKKIELGMYHSLVLLNDGTVKSWGRNNYGQLGVGGKSDRVIPTVISGLTNVVDISTGGNHSLALLSDGTVKAWGYNQAGRLGDKTQIDRDRPIVVQNLPSNIIQVEAGADTSYALTSDGKVYSWGYNPEGERGDGTIYNNVSFPILTNMSNVRELFSSSSSRFAFALLNDGSVLSWGENSVGQLGLGNTSNTGVPTKIQNLSDVKSIGVGTKHVVALSSNGSLKVWGDNTYFQLGLDKNSIPLSTTPIDISLERDIQELFVGSRDNYIRKSDDFIYGWGFNDSCSLGDGNATRYRYNVYPTYLYK